MKYIYNKLQESMKDMSIGDFMRTGYVRTLEKEIRNTVPRILCSDYCDTLITDVYGEKPILWWQTTQIGNFGQLIFSLDVNGDIRVKKLGDYENEMMVIGQANTSTKALEKLKELIPLYMSYVRLTGGL